MILFGDKQKDFIKSDFTHTLEVNEGTPRSGKTTAGVFRYARYLIETPDENHLIVGYNQEQAFRLFMESDGFGLIHIFDGVSKIRHDGNGDHLEIHTPNGVKKVFYKGGGKADSVKAITGMSLGSVVFCEINLLHMDMIQECFRRTYASQLRYHLADLNPPAPNHPIIKDVFDAHEAKWRHWTINDNPIITEERKQEILKPLLKNPYLYKRDWLGQRVMPEGVIYSMFDMDKNIEKSLLGKRYEMYFTADGGQADSTTVSCNIVTRYEDKLRLNRVAHYYHSGRETGQVKAMSIYAKEIKEFVNWCVKHYEMRYAEFFVDPACKSLREELHLLGIQTSKANNNAKDIKGSIKGIEVGIERAQNLITNGQFFLVDNNKYDHYNFIKEIGMYCREDNGKPMDKWNDAMDEFRYACNYFYQRYVL